MFKILFQHPLNQTTSFLLWCQVFRRAPGLDNLIFRFITFISSFKSSICILELLHLDASLSLEKFLSSSLWTTQSLLACSSWTAASRMLCVARHVQAFNSSSSETNKLLFMSFMDRTSLWKHFMIKSYGKVCFISERKQFTNLANYFWSK